MLFFLRHYASVCINFKLSKFTYEYQRDSFKWVTVRHCLIVLKTVSWTIVKYGEKNIIKYYVSCVTGNEYDTQ